MSIFQHTSEAKDTVDSRRAEYQATFAPDGKDYHKAKTRRNAYAKISGGGDLPTLVSTYDDLYSNTEGKPDVILNSVSVKEVADFGMARKVEVKFTCLNRASFETYEEGYLRPKTSVTIEIGYVNGDDSDSFSDFQIGKYAYNLDDKNRYICSFTAYGPGPFINHIDIKAAGKMKGMKIVTDGFFKSPISTISGFLKWTAQGGEGGTANVDIPNWTTPDGAPNKVWILDSPLAYTPDNFITKGVYKVLQAVGLVSGDSSKLIYCTLQWLCESIQTHYLDPIKDGALKGRKLVCNGVVSKGAHPISNVGSAYPMSFVLAGGGNGHYGSKLPASRESHIDFDSNVDAVIAGSEADYSKILISYNYIAGQMFGVANSKGNIFKQLYKRIAGDTSTGAKDAPDIKLGDVMNGLFDDIYHTTGGAVQLAIMENPADSNELHVVSRNGKQDDIKETVFDPINGDGITRKCTVTCDPPVSDVYAAMDAGTSKSYAANSIASQPDSEPSADEDPITEAKSKLTELMEEGLSANDFENGDCDALAAVFKTLVEKATKAQAVELPDTRNTWPLKLNVEIDGTSGFRFGDVINSTFLPAAYRQEGIAVTFCCTEVSQDVEGQDWKTSLKGIMRLSRKS